MWLILACLACLACLVYAWRCLLVKTLTLRSRDVRALHSVRRALRFLCADESLASFDPSKDRSALIPGESRRKRVKLRRTGREAARKACVEAMRKRL